MAKSEFCDCGLIVHEDDEKCPCCKRHLIWEDGELRCVDGSEYAHYEAEDTDNEDGRWDDYPYSQI